MEGDTKLTSGERIEEMLRFALHHRLVSSKAEFADFLGVAPETLSRYLSGKREPPLNQWKAFNVKLMKAFNEDWLLTGSGEMMSRNLTQIAETPKSSTIDMLVLELREARIASDEQINRLLGIIENMQSK